jgi:cell division protein FtsB
VDLSDKTSYYANLHNLKQKNQVETCQKQEIEELTLRNHHLEAKTKQLQSQLTNYEKER